DHLPHREAVRIGGGVCVLEEFSAENHDRVVKIPFGLDMTGNGKRDGAPVFQRKRRSEDDLFRGESHACTSFWAFHHSEKCSMQSTWSVCGLVFSRISAGTGIPHTS